MTTRDITVTVGQELTPVSEIINKEMCQDFSGWLYQRDFHTLDDEAHARGFPSLLVQGAFVASYMSRMCLDFFGQSWFNHGKLKVRFRRPVFVPQRVTAKGKVAAVAAVDGGTLVTLEVWVEDEAGEKVQTGSASCLIS